MRLHTNAYRCFLVIFTFILLFSMALSANAQEYTARTRESLVNSIIKQNDDYIGNIIPNCSKLLTPLARVLLQ